MKNSNLEFVRALIREMNEELKGKQKNLDVAAPFGKLTGADFKKLRGMKKESHPRNEQWLEQFYSALEAELQNKPELQAKVKNVLEIMGDSGIIDMYGMFQPYVAVTPFLGDLDELEDHYQSGLQETHEGQDHEVSMAQNSLKSIISSASQLMNMLGQDEKDIPAWIQDHITNAENYINQASKNYHEYHNGEEDMDELPVGNEEEPVDDMTLQSIAEAKFISLKDFSKNLELHKKGDITKSQLITSYNKLSAKDQDKAKELAKDLDVLPKPKKIDETSLKSIMETVVKRKKAK